MDLSCFCHSRSFWTIKFLKLLFQTSGSQTFYKEYYQQVKTISSCINALKLNSKWMHHKTLVIKPWRLWNSVTSWKWALLSDLSLVELAKGIQTWTYWLDPLTSCYSPNTNKQVNQTSWRPSPWVFRLFHESLSVVLTHPCALAGFILVVDLLLCPFVQFSPQGFDFPGADRCLQRAIEVAVVQRIQLELSAENTESLQSPFAGGGLDKVLKKLAGLSRALILRLTHLHRWKSESTIPKNVTPSTSALSSLLY